MQRRRLDDLIAKALLWSGNPFVIGAWNEKDIRKAGRVFFHTSGKGVRELALEPPLLTVFTNVGTEAHVKVFTASIIGANGEYRIDEGFVNHTRGTLADATEWFTLMREAA